jgi:hypothetical protein
VLLEGKSSFSCALRFFISIPRHSDANALAAKIAALVEAV